MRSRREARNEKDMYQKMFNKTQKLESKGKHSKTAGDQDMPKVCIVNVLLFRNVRKPNRILNC